MSEGVIEILESREDFIQDLDSEYSSDYERMGGSGVPDLPWSCEGFTPPRPSNPQADCSRLSHNPRVGIFTQPCAVSPDLPGIIKVSGLVSAISS